MQVVKKGIKLSIGIIGITLFCACTREVPVSIIPTQSITPSSEIELTLTPVITQTISPTEVLASPTKEPTKEVSKTPSPTEVATITLTPKPTETIKPTETKEPTETIKPTETKEPTETIKPTETKEPTETIKPTETKEPTETMKPTEMKEPTVTTSPIATTTPTIDNEEEKVSIDMTQESLLKNGWQSMVDISQTYYVVFSECFNDSKVIKDENRLDIRYTSKQEKNIEFQVLYSIGQTIHHVLGGVTEQGGIILEEDVSNGIVSYKIEKKDMVYQGVILEKEYKKELLGDNFGEGDSVVGTMQVVFTYPKAQYAKYEADDFNYYLVKIP